MTLAMQPAQAHFPLDDEALVAFCTERIEKGSKSFAGASKLFDPETRASAILLYAWCRHCDDVIDGQDLGFAPGRGLTTATRDRLEALRAETRSALRGAFSDPVFQALHTVAEAHDIPECLPLDLIAGFEMDVDEHRYDSFDQTLTYCYHVAGVVGVMMAHIMGVKAADHTTLARACDLGIAFQLTNIARDVIADAEAGRVYLPADLLRHHGLEPSAMDIAAPQNRARLADAVADLLREADRYYSSAGVGIAQLPLRSAWAIATARRVYRDIGGIVRTRGEAAWDRRASTGRATKLAGMTTALFEAAIRRSFFKVAPGMLGLSARPNDLWTPPYLRRSPVPQDNA